MPQTVTEILKGIKNAYPYPINAIMACSCGLGFDLTEQERLDLKSGKMKFKTKYENKKLLREEGLETHIDIPDFPWNK